LYCPPTPATGRQGSFNPFAILHVPFYRSPPPPRPIAGGGGALGPSRGHIFGRRGEREENGITPPHARWQRAQKILVLVTLMPHMQNGQGQNHPLLFWNFFYIVKIIEKSLFYEPEIGFIGKKTFSKFRGLLVSRK
jgi:hypothetical protein